MTDDDFRANIEKARSRGLSAALIAKFVTAGPSSLAALADVVDSPPTLGQLNASNAAIEALRKQYGQ